MPELKVPVKFSTVSIGEDVARLGFSAERAELKLSAADRFMCNSRVDVLAVIIADQDDDGQSFFDGLAPEPLKSTADIKGFRVDRKTIGAGLSFALSEVDVTQLAKFAGRRGHLSMTRIGAIPDKSPKLFEDPEEGTEVQVPKGAAPKMELVH